MKVIVNILILSLILFGQISHVLADEITIQMPTKDIIVTEDAEGYARFTGEDILYLSQSGEPALPYQLIKVLLPPKADLSTVSVSMEDKLIEGVSGEWEVRPAPPAATYDGTDIVIFWPEGKTIINKRDIGIYEKDAFFPTDLIGDVKTGLIRKWRLVDIPIALYQYNPANKKLYHLIEGTLVVKFTSLLAVRSAHEADMVYADRIGEDIVKKLAVNFEEVAPAYQAMEVSPDYQAMVPRAVELKQKSGYVIITTDSIKNKSKTLVDFVKSKKNRGFNVEVVTEDVWGGGTGNEAAENIRNWLKTNYLIKCIQYVLLIGDPKPETGEVPMKVLYPRKNCNPELDDCVRPTQKVVYSDFYYAELTGDWNLDGDQFYGEWDKLPLGDAGDGGIEWFGDVLIGRIPVFWERVEDLDSILQKIIEYENEPESSTSWRKNVLLPMKPIEVWGTPTILKSYLLGEEIKEKIVKPKDWRYYRIYDENYGLQPPPETIPCTIDNVTRVWSNSHFGSIFWWSHGGPTEAPGIMDTIHAEKYLHAKHPAFTFQASCSNSDPQWSSISYQLLLQDAAIATVGATTEAWFELETTFEGSRAEAGMAFEYAKQLITNEMDSGHALHILKTANIPKNNRDWMNYLVFNLFGDPSVGLFTFVDDRPFILTPNLSHSIGVRFSNNDGTFEVPILVGDDFNVNYGEVAIADFTGDGLLDFITSTNENPARLYLFTNTGQTSFKQTFLNTLDSDPKANTRE